MFRSQWWKHGFLNLLEHGITRAGDALASLLLIWVLAPEVFARLALAQAWIAPLLFFFVAPEVVLYREYASWRAEGRQVFGKRLYALRIFGYWKIPAAILLSLAISLLMPATAESTQGDTFWSLLWAFSLALGPQVSGADREFLRLDLKLGALNVLTLLQKFGLLGGTIAAVLLFPGNTMVLALTTSTVIATATLLAKFLAGSALKDIPQAEVPHALPSAIATLRYSLTSFSLWSHVQGVLYGWVQTMDLFVLGLGGLLGGAAVIPAATLGLYATVSKLTGFAFALPQALGNLFSLWLGRRTSDPSERKRVWNTSGGLFLIGVAQALVLTLLAPLILHFLSRGRFSPSDIAEMSHWFYFKIWSTTGWVAALVMMSWLFARGHIRAVLFQITLPWAAFSLLAFTLAARLGGPSATAQANVLSAGVLCALSIGLFLRKR